MEPLQVAYQIEKAIHALGDEGKLAIGLVKDSARATADYDKALGTEVARLKGDGQPVTTIEKIAKGNVSDSLYAKLLAEGALKAHYSRMSQLKEQLGGLRSINKYLDSTQGR